MKWLLAVTFVGISTLPSWAARHTPDASAQSSLNFSTKQSSQKRVRHAKGKRSTRKRGPSYQLHPDPERYQEIQKALADRGYFKGEVNGKWGDDSIEALKRFQADQKLPDDGKINSLSLIGLGLGPKHDGNSVTPTNGASTPAAQPPPTPQPLPPSNPEDFPR
jgi:Putative peptidoglycan binding domain